MIIIHDKNLAPQHLIYEHPPGYETQMDTQGLYWVKASQAVSPEHIELYLDPATLKRALRHRKDGVEIALLRTSDH